MNIVGEKWEALEMRTIPDFVDRFLRGLLHSSMDPGCPAVCDDAPQFGSWTGGG